MRIISASLILFVVIASCKKDNPPQPPQKLRAYFSFDKICNRVFMNDSTQFIDSLVLFINRSDTSQQESYKWDFGDNNFSTEINPVHSYSKPGRYAVKLYTFRANQPSDTFSRNMRIIIGQQEFRTNKTNTYAVDVDETDDGGAILLTSEYNGNEPPSYSLFKVDSLLHQQWAKTPAGDSIRLNSLKKLSTNEYILSGNYQPGNTHQFSLSKINVNGDPIWTKYIAGLEGSNNYTLSTSDGNLITIGNGGSPGSVYTAVVKCDGDGNEIWRKLFDGIATTTLIRHPHNIIETASGYAFASLTPGTNQIALTTLDFNGNITGQSFASSGNIGTIFEAGVAYANNSFMVFATNTPYIFMFNSSLSFIESRMTTESGINDGIAANGHFYLADGNHQYGDVTQLNSGGTINWNAGINNVIPLSCTSALSGATRRCKKIVYTSNNEIFALSDGDPKSSTLVVSAYLEKFLSDGMTK